MHPSLTSELAGIRQDEIRHAVKASRAASLARDVPVRMRALGPAAMTLGKAEGLDAHSRSVGLRLHLT